jgi:hypothetical protein
MNNNSEVTDHPVPALDFEAAACRRQNAITAVTMLLLEKRTEFEKPRGIVTLQLIRGEP